jgi:hypothetical protein
MVRMNWRVGRPDSKNSDRSLPHGGKYLLDRATILIDRQFHHLFDNIKKYLTVQGNESKT